jgi:hypothetical protein
MAKKWDQSLLDKIVLDDSSDEEVKQKKKAAKKSTNKKGKGRILYIDVIDKKNFKETIEDLNEIMNNTEYKYVIIGRLRNYSNKIKSGPLQVSFSCDKVIFCRFDEKKKSQELDFLKLLKMPFDCKLTITGQMAGGDDMDHRSAPDTDQIESFFKKEFNIDIYKYSFYEYHYDRGIVKHF